MLKEKLADYLIEVSCIFESHAHTFFHRTMAEQVIRASSSANLNYAEASVASSSKDFIHKMRLVGKEMKESETGLTLVKKKGDMMANQEIDNLIARAQEISAMVYVSIRTAKKNLDNKNNRKKP